MTQKVDVATVLERETQVTIDSWYARVEEEPGLKQHSFEPQ